jgi:trans-aconitate 2-methyltransferase
MPWDPDKYHQFKGERQAPFFDLLSLVRVREDLKVIDLGCGTGELTALLVERLPRSQVLGIDNSPQMLERAAQYRGPNLRFELRAVEEAEDEWDLIFSNAALQWVEGHETLVPRLMGMLRPGGQLAVQVPSNHNHPAQSIVRDIAGEEPFMSALGGFVRHSPVLPINRYAEILYTCSGRDLNVFEKVYPQVLESANAIADFTTGTVLVPYRERLTPEMWAEFDRIYRERLKKLYPGSPVFYGFRRTFFSANTPALSTIGA